MSTGTDQRGLAYLGRAGVAPAGLGGLANCGDKLRPVTMEEYIGQIRRLLDFACRRHPSLRNPMKDRENGNRNDI